MLKEKKKKNQIDGFLQRSVQRVPSLRYWKKLTILSKRSHFKLWSFTTKYVEPTLLSGNINLTSCGMWQLIVVSLICKARTLEPFLGIKDNTYKGLCIPIKKVIPMSIPNAKLLLLPNGWMHGWTN